MLLVVGEEGEHPVGVHNLGAEHGAVPAHELLEARRATHDVRELTRLHHAAIPGEPALPVLSIAHVFSFVCVKTPRSSVSGGRPYSAAAFSPRMRARAGASRLAVASRSSSTTPGTFASGCG